MALDWSNNLSTGLPWQDAQHKELLKRINKLLDAMDVGLGKEEVVKLFTFLDEYVVVHFRAEEEAMDKIEYPGLDAHVAEHARLIEGMARLKTEFTSAPSTTLVIMVKRRVVDWLIHHIGGDDKKFGEFIINSGEFREKP